MTAMLVTENLTKRFRKSIALDGLNLEVPPGSVFALVGPNGAGKTTTIKTALNVIQPTAGKCRVLGVESTRLGPSQLAEIGYVSENQQLPARMTVAQFFSFCRRLYPSWDEADLTALLRLYELPLDRSLSALSRGMKMKAALAAALAHRPRLIVLDEPFSGLDVAVREQLIESVLERTPESTVLLASHDLSEIESFATHIAYLSEGRLLFAEEMASLSARFREVEVTLPGAAQLPPDCPSSWHSREVNSSLARFVDSQWSDETGMASVRQCFPQATDISARGMSLRAMFLALSAMPKHSVHTR
jgi:ABC-2 type transport system ATP-binding protein